jgi:hypothetical protein
MSQVLKFPDIVSRRTPKDGTLKEAVAGTEAKVPGPPVMREINGTSSSGY